MTMTSLIKSAAFGLLLTIAPLAHSHAREAVVGLSPNQSPDMLKSQIQKVITHIAKTVEPGENAWFFDAEKLRLIGVFEVPDKAAYRNPKAKLQVNRKLLGQLKQFIDGARVVPGRKAVINLSGLMRVVRRNYPALKARDMIVLGSPVADHSKAPSVSMRENRVPNDGHIMASAGISPYGTTGLAGSLKDYALYFGLTGPDWSVSSAHAWRVERFWTVSMESHGGHIAYFGDDLGTMFSLAGKDTPERKHEQPLVPTTKLEMLQFATDQGAVPDIYVQPLQAEPAPQPLWKAATSVRIGITWDCMSCDIDLYVRTKPSAPVIFFDQANTPEGRLFKDYLQSPRTGFETVHLNGVVDLSQTRIALNFYGGKASNRAIKGELRIAIGGNVWATLFEINAFRGNKAKGAEIAVVENKAPNDHWVIVDPMTVLSAQ